MQLTSYTGYTNSNLFFEKSRSSYAFGSPIKDFTYADTTRNGINGFVKNAKDKYRYGFNGEELESDISGEGMAYDLGARFYDSRLGRMFSLDPMMDEYPWQSPYAYCDNRPVTTVDIDGMGTEVTTTPPTTHTVVSGDNKYNVAKAHYTAYGNGLGLSWGEYWTKFQEWNKNVSLKQTGVTLYLQDPGAKPKVIEQKKPVYFDLTPHYTYSDYKYHCIERQVHSSSQRCSTIVETGYTSDPEPENKPVQFTSKASATPWVTAAETQLGQKEKNPGDNAAIVGYHATTTGKAKDDNTPWCASFVNWSFTQSGIKGQNSARALDWRKWGTALSQPAYGSVGIIDWGGSKGHVGFVVGVNKSGQIILLGGNQSDMVKYSPFNKSVFVKYVYPTGFTPSFKLPILTLSGSTTLKATR